MRAALLVTLLLAACTGPSDDGARPSDDTGPDDTAPDVVWECVLAADPVPDHSAQIGCRADFDLLAADPLDASIPGAQSSKTVVDRVDGNTLYFTNSELYPIHYDFASAFLSGGGLPIVGDMGSFNAVEYYSPDRRFLLGAVTWYEEPGVWVYEIAPYDTADAEMIATAYRLIAENAYFGDDLYFHPTSEAVAEVAIDLPADVRQISTDELYAGITYQPLNLGTAMGQLRFYTAEEVEDYVNYREIVVLDEIPNDISIVAATVTGEFQTPLAHINVLAQNRGTPNMALVGAYDNVDLRALEGKWVELTVEALGWTIREVTEAEADAWWASNAPEQLDVNRMDTSVTGLWDCEDILDLSKPLPDAIAERVPAFGGKATNMAALVHIGDDVPVPPCFATPLYYYDQHMRQNGLWDRYTELTLDPGWGDSRTRADLLAQLQAEIQAAPLDRAFLALVMAKIDADFGRAKMRFRSSTNAEDLGNFTGAGLYTSKSGEWDAAGADIEDAIKEVWASVWGPRAWEEREYWGIDHTKVGMAMLSNPAYDGEDANGVAVTGNVFDTAGLEPAFYVNVQAGENSVVLPEDGDTTDQILYYYTLPGQPIVYIAHSNLVPDGETVLTESELYQLGTALDAIHDYFYEAYGTSGGFYAMDTEFKFVDGQVQMKQARPYPGWSVGE
ncbi:MAG: PEP/pyruvate-binding domain-containing protein [Myxococcota bacterium]